MQVPVAVPPSSSAPPRPRLLLVDDEENILSSLRRLLRRDFEVETTTNAYEALDHLSSDAFAVLLTDQRMPIMEGTELARRAQELSPDTVRIILTGYADASATIAAINAGAVFHFLVKPWNEEELIRVLHQAASQFALVRENRRLEALTQSQNEELASVNVALSDANDQLTGANDKLETANQALKGKVLERTRQVTELKGSLANSFKVSFQMLERLIEMHSADLGSHSRRVGELTRKLGASMGFEGDALFQLDMAARLHDIGKVGVDPKFLRGESVRLKARERAVLLTHAVRGAGLVQMTSELADAATYVRHHHEHFDGTGAPDRLVGDAIPLGARLIAVVDGYDNWRNRANSLRVVSPAEAMQFVSDHAGTQFDPAVVAALRTMLENDVEGRLRVQEHEVALGDLTLGMVLARDLLTLDGQKVLPRGTLLDDGNVQRLRSLASEQLTMEAIFVYQ